MPRTFVVLGCLLAGALSAVGVPTATVTERFFTPFESADLVDSLASWRGPEGQHWLLATAKGSHTLRVHDGGDGAFLRRVGELGDALGQFRYPNGIAVVDDLVLVAERDNHRVQVLHLPEFTPLLAFGQEEMASPYGLYVEKLAAGDYRVCVTDNYRTPEKTTPLPAELGHRVQVYRLQVSEGGEPPIRRVRWERAFGATAGRGVLTKVESIWGDPASGRLLVADESPGPEGQCIKVYTAQGAYTGETLGEGIFRGEPEGLVLCETGPARGYWIAADQGTEENWFHLFERQSLRHVGSFRGAATRNTDGICLDPRPLGAGWAGGVFYAVHDDGAVAAFAWHEVVEALALEN